MCAARRACLLPREANKALKRKHSGYYDIVDAGEESNTVTRLRVPASDVVRLPEVRNGDVDVSIFDFLCKLVRRIR
eukprot:SAG31_NODE_1751_length_7353_cov_6.874552_3_plen_76_part_00